MVSSRRRRRVLAAVILLGWVAVLAWHARREYFRPVAVRLAEASANLVPSVSHYAVKLGGATIGYASSSIDTLPDGFLLQDELRLHVLALGKQTAAGARTVVNLSERLELKDFEFALRSGFGDFRVSGAMRGDSAVDLQISAGGDEQRLTLATEGPILLPQVMPMHFALGGELRPGSVYTYEVFDPSLMERQRVEMELLDKETLVFPDSAVFDAGAAVWQPARYDTVDTWHVSQRFGGVRLEAWLDPDGQVVRATSPLGYTIERTAFEIAWSAYRALEARPAASEAVDAPDVIEQTAISLGVRLPEGERLAALAVRLRDIDPAGFDLEGERQRLRGDTLFVETEADLGAPGYRLPADTRAFGETLGSTPLVQADDAEIRRAAEAAVDGASDPRIAARRLNDWVYRNLRKEVTFSIPSARQVLEARSGDCNEHTVLFVAMARAVGLPARTAAGLVYVRDGFYYHAWPEVWLGRWVPVDPTLGQFPADASHLRFVVGGLARQVELVRLIGTLKLDVVSVEER
jgi:transglutaminase-like putative cysteine protease